MHSKWSEFTQRTSFRSEQMGQSNHESLENVTPLDVYSVRYREVLSERKKIKRLTMQRRKREYRAAKAA